MYKPRPVETILNIWDLKHSGTKQRDIAKYYGMSEPHISTILRLVREHLESDFPEHPTNRNYVEVAQIIKQRSDITPKTKETSTSKQKSPNKNDASDFDILERAVDGFIQDVTLFIEKQVAQQKQAVQTQIKKLESENERNSKLLQSLEAENLELRKVAEEAKRSNWVGNLRERLSPQSKA